MSYPGPLLPNLLGRNTSDNPDVPRSSTGGNVIPPDGPKVADFNPFNPESMWGEDVECFSDLRWRIGGRIGEPGTSKVVGRILRPVESVLRLSWLGLRFIAGIFGLIKSGDEGSETSCEDNELAKGGCIDNPFMFRARRGEGDVIGRSRLLQSLTVRLSMVEGRPPKLVAGKEFNGIKLTGESGEEDGEGSEREEVSVVKVVVGEESADSEFCVDVLSW